MKLICLGLYLFSIHAFSQSLNDFQRGKYYDIKGRTTSGLISYAPHRRAHPFVLFKTDEKAKATRVKASKMKGFVIGADTFATVRNFVVEGVHDPIIKVPVAIGQVVEVGRVVLYKCQYVEKQMMSHYTDYAIHYREADVIHTFVVGQINSDRFMSVPEGQYEFNERMSAYFKINPELASRIRSGTWSNGKVQSLVKEFNEWYAGRQRM